MYKRQLIQCGYERVAVVENIGQFSIRGGIFDIYPPIGAGPFRVELFDDEVDSIRNFNPETQRSIDKLDKIKVFPAKEIIITEKNIESGKEIIEAELKEAVNGFLKMKDKEAADRITKTVKANLESLNETWSFETVDSYMPYFYDKQTSLLDYFPDSVIAVSYTHLKREQ